MGTFSNNSDSVSLSTLVGSAELSRHFLRIRFNFRNHCNFSTASDSCHESEITAVTPHDFYKKRSSVRRGGDLQSVDRLKRNIEGGIDSEGNIRATKIVINCRCNADYGE